MTDPLERLSQLQQEEAEHALKDPKIKERLMVSTLIQLRDQCGVHEKKIKRLEKLAILFSGIITAAAIVLPWLFRS